MALHLGPITSSSKLWQLEHPTRINGSHRYDAPGRYATVHNLLTLEEEPLMSKSLMLGVTAALLLMGCVSQQKYTASQQKNSDLEQEYQQLNQTMSSEVAARNIQISRMQDAIKVTVNSELLFPSGGWEMPADAKASIAKIAAILAPHQAMKLDVNGYTDSTPIGPGLSKQGVTTNLILSQRRADNVMQFMIAQGVKADLVSAHGFGEADPVASNDSPLGRAQNRRVELTVSNPAT
jgi:chemotaxis protein MotB